MTTESIFSERACNKGLGLSFFAPGKSWDNVCSTVVPYTESRLTRSVANDRVGFPLVEQSPILFPYRQGRKKIY
ncbi:MAG: hypothetical protein ACK55Z_08905, partial [bacterium]